MFTSKLLSCLVPIVLVGVFLTHPLNADELPKMRSDFEVKKNECRNKTLTDLPFIGIDLLKGLFDHDKNVIKDGCDKLKNFVDDCFKKVLLPNMGLRDTETFNHVVFPIIDHGFKTFCSNGFTIRAGLLSSLIAVLVALLNMNSF